MYVCLCVYVCLVLPFLFFVGSPPHTFLPVCDACDVVVLAPSGSVGCNRMFVCAMRDHHRSRLFLIDMSYSTQLLLMCAGGRTCQGQHGHVSSNHASIDGCGVSYSAHQFVQADTVNFRISFCGWTPSSFLPAGQFLPCDLLFRRDFHDTGVAIIAMHGDLQQRRILGSCKIKAQLAD